MRAADDLRDRVVVVRRGNRWFCIGAVSSIEHVSGVIAGTPAIIHDVSAAIVTQKT